MRYMGDLVAPSGAVEPFCHALPSDVAAHLVSRADTFDDACARQLVDVGNATRLGRRENLARVAVSAGLGLLIGAGVGAVLARRLR